MAYYEEGKQLPNHPVVITVDDGYVTFYNLAFPLLREMNLPATILLPTDFADHHEPLSPERVE